MSYEVADITNPYVAVDIDGYSAGYAAGASAGTPTVAPVIDGVPTISGTTSVGYTLTATPAPLSEGTEPIVQAWQWYADAVAIAGATSSTYALTLTEQGAAITVTQTETGDGTDSATSAATAAVGAPVAPTSVLPPQISGPRGGTLTYVAGTYTGSSPITTAPAWQTSPIGDATWTTVSTSATYDDSSTSALDLRILETPTGPGGAGTPVASQTMRGVVVTGAIDVSTLTPYATVGYAGTISSGDTLAGTIPAGAAQVYSDGAARFYAIPRNSDGAAWSAALGPTALRVEVVKNAIASDPSAGRAVGILVGLAVSTGAIGSGPGGAPATLAEVDRWALGGMISDPMDPHGVEPDGTALIDTTGSTIADTTGLELTSNLVRGTSGDIVVDRYSVTQILTGGVASSAGKLTRTPIQQLWAAGDAVAIVSIAYRGATTLSDSTYDFGAYIDLLQRASPS